MPRTAVFEGTRYQVPDDATNDEIASFVESQIKPKETGPKQLTATDKVKNLLRGKGYTGGRAEAAEKGGEFEFPTAVKAAGALAGGVEMGMGAAELGGALAARAAAKDAPEIGSVVGRMSGTIAGKITKAAGKIPKVPEVPSRLVNASDYIPGAGAIRKVAKIPKAINKLTGMFSKEEEAAAPAVSSQPANKPPYSSSGTAGMTRGVGGKTAATSPIETPVQSADPREVGFSRLQAQAKAKDISIAKSLLESYTPEQVERMSDSEINVIVKKAGYQPFRGKGLSRSPAAGKADIAKKMRELAGSG
jgi:hypothetical protein